MISEQILTKKVVDYLRDNHNTRLNLPNLFRSIDSKVTLKYLKSFPIGKKQNRYDILINKTDQLLKKNLLNLDKIKLFSQDFFNTITQDIIILQQNDKLRKKIPYAKDQILYKNQQISGFQLNIKTQCLLVNDKHDILSFISDNLKSYLIKLNLISEEYNNINKLEILTSINIDDLYQDRLADQNDYSKHYTPLLQVLHKLKSNMIRLYQEIESCDPYDVPLRCVNFLANCKNLISELQPFLLSNDCAFNRLIFYVVKCQKENLQLVASNYQQALTFCRQITSDLFKSYFLGFMFKDSAREIKDTLESTRQQLLKIINDQQIPQIKISQILKIQFNKLQNTQDKLKQLKRVIGIGRDGFMKDYVKRKQCKKLSIINEYRQEYLILRKIIQKFTQYFQIKKQVQKLDNKQVQESIKIIKQIRTLQKISDIKSAFQQTKDKISPQKRFQVTFIKIQQLILEVSTLKGSLQIQLESHHAQKGHQLLIQYISHRIEKLSVLNNNYMELETKLLNTYMSIQQQTAKLQQQSEEIKQKTLQGLEEFIQVQLKPSIGFQICNQDNYCEQVKNKIMELGKAEYMIKQWKKQNVSLREQVKNDQDSIVFYRNNLQWLLTLFEGSMDEKIFQMIMDKLDFESQDYVESQKKVQELIKQLKKYTTDLKNLLKNHPLSQIHPNIYKIIKQRVQLYQIISDIYSECLLVFRQTRAKDSLYNIQNKGLMLFDQDVFKYVLMVYQFRNKIRMEMEELKELMLPIRTKNYLLDQIYQPYSIRYGQYINFKEQQLLNFTLRLQHALNIQLSQKKIITLFEELLSKPYSEEYFSTVQNLCKQMKQIRQQNDLVNNLENEPVVVHNLGKFKQLIQPYLQYYRLAQQLEKDFSKLPNDILNSNHSNQNEQLRLTKKLQLKNSKIVQLKNLVLERWKQHTGKKQSGNRSRADSKSVKNQENRSELSRKNRSNKIDQVQSRLLYISRQE